MEAPVVDVQGGSRKTSQMPEVVSVANNTGVEFLPFLSFIVLPRIRFFCDGILVAVRDHYTGVQSVEGEVCISGEEGSLPDELTNPPRLEDHLVH